MESLYLGTFNQETNTIIISDPSYGFDKENYKKEIMNLNLIIQNVKQGKWNTFIAIDNKTNLISRLFAIYNTKIHYITSQNKWKQFGCVCVDSGQLGLYDIKNYRNDSITENYKLWSFINIDEIGEKWYAMNCEITLNNPECAGVVPNGAVARSGYGDGIYDVYTLTETVTTPNSSMNQVIGINVVFIDENNRNETYDTLFKQRHKYNNNNNNNSIKYP